MAQSVEHVIGNDEVISSILITSSTKRHKLDNRVIGLMPILFAARAVKRIEQFKHDRARRSTSFSTCRESAEGASRGVESERR